MTGGHSAAKPPRRTARAACRRRSAQLSFRKESAQDRAGCARPARLQGGRDTAEDGRGKRPLRPRGRRSSAARPTPVGLCGARQVRLPRISTRERDGDKAAGEAGGGEPLRTPFPRGLRNTPPAPIPPLVPACPAPRLSRCRRPRPWEPAPARSCSPPACRSRRAGRSAHSRSRRGRSGRGRTTSRASGWPRPSSCSGSRAWYPPCGPAAPGTGRAPHCTARSSAWCPAAPRRSQPARHRTPSAGAQRAGTGCAGRPRLQPRAPPAFVLAASPKLGPGRSGRAGGRRLLLPPERRHVAEISRKAALQPSDLKSKVAAAAHGPSLRASRGRPPPVRRDRRGGGGQRGAAASARDGTGRDGAVRSLSRPAFLLLSEKNLRKRRVAARGVGNSVPRAARRMKAQEPATFNPVFGSPPLPRGDAEPAR